MAPEADAAMAAPRPATGLRAVAGPSRPPAIRDARGQLVH